MVPAYVAHVVAADPGGGGGAAAGAGSAVAMNAAAGVENEGCNEEPHACIPPPISE
eukprot:CAMPEP_0202375476 /NCGR_PEP_ID=MMETSP1127-20130417/6151_1 /ASSEMBLY_ACC=CAM_ASM_000462 /TAXON_ID=3047 /ORGANISM="Dunaliella tertiolecta, Strain CCMP1320" /LENGTH=55 /DNA_ID=CAMNT_0048972969 /DNA_START=546 /DNA_END=713 /DNA_ORIENTATION=+